MRRKASQNKDIKAPWQRRHFEVVEDDSRGTFRMVYTVKFAEAVVVLHAFQKKSTTGIKTSQQDKELIESRVTLAIQIYKHWLASKGK